MKKAIVYLEARETAVKTAESRQCAWKNEMSSQVYLYERPKC